MTDLELTRMVAEAMDLSFYEVSNNKPEHTIRLSGSVYSNKRYYWPLTNDAQAMALVKSFNLDIASYSSFGLQSNGWDVIAVHIENKVDIKEHDKDLNRAICECVAKMHSNHQPRGAR